MAVHIGYWGNFVSTSISLPKLIVHVAQYTVTQLKMRKK